jgi:hypothetical protein
MQEHEVGPKIKLKTWLSTTCEITMGFQTKSHSFKESIQLSLSWGKCHNLKCMAKEGQQNVLLEMKEIRHASKWSKGLAKNPQQRE